MTERFLLWKGELLMSNETRNHKDNVFCMLYREKKNLLSLYNAVNGTNYENEEELEVVTLEDAICMKIRNDAACVTENVLAGFFREHRKEIVKMGIFEFDQELHDQAMRKDGEVIGYEKGINDGMEFSKIELVCKKLAKKKSPETIAEELEEDIGKILPICEAAKAFAPEYDSEKVREKYFAGLGKACLGRRGSINVSQIELSGKIGI